MTLVKSNLLFPTLPRFFDDFFTRDITNRDFQNQFFTRTTLPSVNIRENNEAFMVEMAAPGMSKEDFCIEQDNETLTISSQKESENELKEGDRFTRREFNYQSFKRSFQLPKSVVDGSKIKAKYENGLLQILIPKKEEAKALPPRQIAIE